MRAIFITNTVTLLFASTFCLNAGTDKGDCVIPGEIAYCAPGFASNDCFAVTAWALSPGSNSGTSKGTGQTCGQNPTTLVFNCGKPGSEPAKQGDDCPKGSNHPSE